jgi:hypothetical protein
MAIHVGIRSIWSGHFGNPRHCVSAAGTATRARMGPPDIP